MQKTRTNTSDLRRGTLGNLLSDVSAVIFDLEGVILDTEGMWDEAQKVLLARRGHRYDRDALKHKISGLGTEAAIALLIDHYGLVDEPRTLVDERHRIMADLLGRGVTYIPGARDFIRQAAAVADVCIATSMDSDLLAILTTKTDLRTVMAGPILSPADTGGVAKPAPDLFLLAASRLGADPTDCLVIEDSPLGIAAARAAGIRCVALCTTHGRDSLGNADLVCPSWDEVPRIGAAPGTPRS